MLVGQNGSDEAVAHAQPVIELVVAQDTIRQLAPLLPLDNRHHAAHLGSREVTHQQQVDRTGRALH